VSKASRRQQRLARQPGTAGAATPGTTPAGTTSAGSPAGAAGAAGTGGSAGRHNTSPTGTARAGRRERQRVSYQRQSFVERYRGIIIGVAAVAGIALIGAVVFLQATAPAYACSTIFDPAPTPSPAANASPQPGYLQDDMGRRHVTTGDQVKYTYCPPASGNHYNASGQGPIAPRLYGPSDKTVPEGWVHNLEHGALVLLYRGDGEGATPAGQAALRAFFDSFPNSPVCNIQPGTIQGPVITQFDDMKTPFAALVWDRVLPLDTLDTKAILDFYQVWGERTNPEPLCPEPSAAPSAAPSGSAAPSTAPSPSVAPSATPAPSASPSASASSSPAAPVASPSPS
jgi:hypothetical protein